MKIHLKLGGISLMLLGSFLLSCGVDEPKKGLHVFNGIHHNYFELLLKFENDSVYSFIKDGSIGDMPGFKNSLDNFYRTEALTDDGNIKIIDFGTKHTKLSFDNNLIPIELDTLILDNDDYVNSIRFQAEFLLRQSKFDTNLLIRVESYK